MPFSGWDGIPGGKKLINRGVVAENGIRFEQHKGNFEVFKGDLLSEYEFATQVYLENIPSKSGSAGFYPVYTDHNNYLKAIVDIKSSNLILAGKLNGKDNVNLSIPLKRKVVWYPDQQYSDHSLKVYTLKKNTELSAVEIIKSIQTQRDFATQLSDSLKIEYSYNDEWKPLNFDRVPNAGNMIERIAFPKITADAIRITSAGSNPRLPIYKINTDEEITSDYNLRAIKLKDKVILFLDGQQVAELKGQWPASRVGLTGNSMAVTYNGIMLFER